MLKKSWDIKVPVEFLVDKDSYIINGKKYHRVTRVKSVINQPALNYWRAKVGIKKGKEIMNTRGTFGTNFHKLIEVSLRGHKVDASNYGEEMQESLRLFQNFMIKYKIQYESLEQRLWSKKYGFAGTCDCLCLMDGKLMILDWKTSKAIYREFWLQLSAYVVAFEELTGQKVDGCGILSIRDGKMKYETKTYDEIMEYFEIFKCCLTIFNWQKEV